MLKKELTKSLRQLNKLGYIKNPYAIKCRDFYLNKIINNDNITVYRTMVSIKLCASKLVRERILYASGLLLICVHAAAAVIPELIPVPSVPSPVHNPAAKKITPSIIFSVVV